MANNHKNPWTTKSKSLVYTNPWIDVEHHDVLIPSGDSGIYGKVHFKNLAIGIIPLDKNDNTWIIGQHRYPLDLFSWEIPEGGGPIDNDPLLSAQRELKEETGITAKSWMPFLTIYTSNAVCDEKAIVYLARDLDIGISSPEDAEELHLKKLPFHQLYDMAMNGDISDAISVAAILKLKFLMNKQLI